MSVVDVPNAFVQTDLAVDGKAVFVLMAIRDKLADMLVSIAPEVYSPYVTKDKNGNSVLYVKLFKALQIFNLSKVHSVQRTANNTTNNKFTIY